LTGFNHYSDCGCGWCIGGWRGSRSSRNSNHLFLPVRTHRIASFVNPNAICPVCGASVFYYQSPNGGRVFFDELGPPWPKHPCTTSEKIHVVRIPASTSTSRSHSKWFDEGWRVAIAQKITDYYGLKVVDFFMVDSDQTFGASFKTLTDLVEGQTVYLKSVPHTPQVYCKFINLDTFRQRTHNGKILKLSR
jgi:hypothetical protein